MRFFKKTSCQRPTLLGWLLILIVISLSVYVFMVNVASFLTVNKPVEAVTMVVEGWVPDDVLKEALSVYQKEHYQNMIVTGIPLQQWNSITDYKNMAEVTADHLKRLGFQDTIYLAAIPKNIMRDRTYSTALVVKQIFKEHPGWEKSFNIFSMGVHSRRSLLMFERAFGDDYRIGIYAGKDRSFDEKHWWRSSRGFRSVSSELFSYLFVRFFFHPDEKAYLEKIKWGRYLDSVEMYRRKAVDEFSKKETTPLDSAYFVNHYEPPKYFPIDTAYRIKARFTVDTTGEVFEMATNTKRRPHYRVYGYIDFMIHDTAQRLTAYQNVDYMHHPEYGKFLFVPFRDKTNGKTTYGAGRYLDILIPRSDTIFIDFNKAYNPYCAYSERWSCPLVPFENWLEVEIEAGEKKYFEKPLH